MSSNQPHAIWQAPNGTWSLAYFDLPDTEDEPDEDFLVIGFLTTGHPSIDAALLAARRETALYGSPGSLNICEDPEERARLDALAAEFREHN